MDRIHIASLVHRHVRLHTAQRILEMYLCGESFEQLLHDLSPEMRRSVEGLLSAAAESWSYAVTLHAPPPEADDATLWIR